jgi:hypothetical protein
MAGEPDSASHWDEAYAQGETARSWFEEQPGMSLRMPVARYSAAQLAGELAGGGG